MWGLFHFFFMTLIPHVDCPHVAEQPVRYTIHDSYSERQTVPIRQMNKRKGVQRSRHPTRNVLHYLIKMK
jgi:hypothetical protein